MEWHSIVSEGPKEYQVRHFACDAIDEVLTRLREEPPMVYYITKHRVSASVRKEVVKMELEMRRGMENVK